MPIQQEDRRLSRSSAALLIGLVVVIIVGGVLGSLSLLTHFGVLGSRSSANASTVVRGGTWTDDSLLQTLIRSFPMVRRFNLALRSTRRYTCPSSTGMHKG